MKDKLLREFLGWLAEAYNGTMSFDDIRCAIQSQLSAEEMSDPSDSFGPGAWVVEVYPGFFIYRDYDDGDSTTYKRTYSFEEGKVVLGTETTPVEQQWVDAAQETLAEVVRRTGQLSEAATMKTDGGKKFSKSAYLIIGDPAQPSTWKVRVEETPGNVTVAQLGRAAAALTKGFRGNKVQASADDIAAAKRKLRALYARLKADPPTALQEALGVERPPSDAPVVHESTDFEPTGLETLADGTPVIRGMTIAEAGVSENRNHHPAEVLERDGPEVFEGAPIFVTNHVGDQKNVQSLVGCVENVRFQGGRLLGDAVGFASDPTPLKKAYEAAKKLGSKRVGTSMDTPAKFKSVSEGINAAREVARYYRGPKTSLDIVINPSAGGRLTEALEDGDVNKKQKLALLTLPIVSGMTAAALREMLDGGATEAEVREAVTDTTLGDAIIARLAEGASTQNNNSGAGTGNGSNGHVTEQGGGGAGGGVDVEEVVKRATESLRNEFALSRCGETLTRRLTEVKDDVGELGVMALTGEFHGRVYEVADLDKRIGEVRELAAKSRPRRPYVPGTGNGTGVATVTESMEVNIERLYAACLQGSERWNHKCKDQRVRPFGTIKEALFAFNPEMIHSFIDNPIQACHEALHSFQWGGGLLDEKVTEASLGTDQFTYAWLTVTRRILERETADPDLNVWRDLISDVVSFQDLTNTYTFVHIGELGAAPKVVERGTYQYLAKPTEERQVIAPAKYGGLFAITWEAVLRDDINYIARIPRDMARAYLWTVYDTIFGLFQLNSGNGQTMDQDSNPLYDASHNNLATSAFSATALETVRAKMVKQTDPSSGKRKSGYAAKYLMYQTPDLDQSIWEAVGSNFKLTASAAEINLPNYIRQYLNLIPVPVIYPTATTTRWELMANPADAHTIAVGYLAGRDTPDIFIQDQETVGARFMSDEITYKERFTLGAALIEYRSFSRGNT